MVKRYEPHLKEVRGEDPTATMLEWVNGDWIEYGDYEALAAELAEAKRQLGLSGSARIALLSARVEQLEAALREIASYEGPDHLLDINAKNMRDAAREALGSQSETGAKHE